jgi:hypothetical protein
LFNDSIKKMWDLDVSGLECVIIVPKDCFNDDTARWLKSKWLYDSRVTYLAGDIMNEEDARRTSLKTAKALFLIPEINGGDDDTVIRAVSYEICTCIFICLFLINNNLHCLSTVLKHWHYPPPPLLLKHLKAHAQQMYGSQVQLYVMLHSKKLQNQLIHSRIPKHRILCLDAIKFRLTAAAAKVPGSTNLLLNLLSFSTS